MPNLDQLLAEDTPIILKRVVSVAAIAALAGVSMPLARRILHPLATVHLVTVDGSGMVHLLAPVHAYACELVATEETDNERRAAAQRLVTWYIHTARAAYRAIIGNVSAENEPSGGGVPDAEGVCAQEFLDRAAAIAWCEAEDTNISAVSSLANEYGPFRAVSHLGAAWANLKVLLRSSVTSSSRVLLSEVRTERTTDPSTPQAAALETRDDVSSLPSHHQGGMKHGVCLDLWTSPATTTPATDRQAQVGLLRPNDHTRHS
jgi:hypothetical protein